MTTDAVKPFAILDPVERFTFYEKKWKGCIASEPKVMHASKKKWTNARLARDCECPAPEIIELCNCNTRDLYSVFIKRPMRRCVNCNTVFEYSPL